jgi:hypothetical protein
MSDRRLMLCSKLLEALGSIVDSSTGGAKANSNQLKEQNNVEYRESSSAE